MHAVDRQARQDSGWAAELHLGFRAAGARTVLAERHRHGPLSVQRPFYPEDGVCHVYLLHPPGGVVGGDRLDIAAQVDANAHALVTTPGATKFYRSAARRAHQEQRLNVADGGSLEWLPQENIFFPGADVVLDTRVELHGSARCALWEIQCLGRPAIDEAFSSGRVDSALSLYRDGEPLLLERLRVDSDARCRLSLLAGRPVTGTLLFSHAGPEQLDECRALLCDKAGDASGATLIDDLLIVRYLGDSAERARRLFTSVWQALRPGTLARPASTPRIWAT